jgi:hypothetical protein
MPKGGQSDDERKHKHQQQDNTPQAKALSMLVFSLVVAVSTFGQ